MSLAPHTAKASSQVYDLAVVGGGLVGTSIAYGLRGSGQRIAVLDEGDVAFRASRGRAVQVRSATSLDESAPFHAPAPAPEPG